MKRREIVYAPEFEEDIYKLFDFIVARTNTQTALNYISRIETFCNGLELASERGTLRNDIRTGLRIIGFERRAVVAFTVEEYRVVVLRFFSGGKNWEAIEWKTAL
jgi:toxin ParE1/3/4